jgi:predicted nucleotidyltransferase
LDLWLNLHNTKSNNPPNNILKEIHSKTECMNSQSRNYINDAVAIIKREIGIDGIVSIILFGSQLFLNENQNESTKISDCDLLIIFKDGVSNNLMRKVDRYFIALEHKHNFREENKSTINKMASIINQTTGMFVSHFLTKKKHWENAIFHKIFNVNKIISHLVAPTKIVLCNVVINSEILYGLDLRERIKKRIKISPLDMIKSITMNLIISLFAIPLLLLKSFDSAKYQLEAVKWTLKASNYYAFKDSKPIIPTIKRFISLEKSEGNKRKAEKFYRKFLNLRKNPHVDLGFTLQSPVRIIKIHLMGIQRAKR